MAHTSPLSPRTLEHLASQIGRRLTPRGADAARRSSTALELAESFEVWSIAAHDVGRRGASLKSIAHPTRRWHHQIRHDGRGVEYARSAPHGPADEDWEIRSVVTSSLARKVDEAIAWIDENVREGDPLVRMLSIPAYLTTCLWLTGDGVDSVVIVDKPRAFRSLVPRRLYTSQELLAALAEERPVGRPALDAPRAK